MTILFNNINAPAISSQYSSSGGPAIVVVRGDDFTGVTIDIQTASSSDPSDPIRWSVLTNGSFTAANTFNITYLPPGLLLRAVATGVGASDNIFVEIIQ